MSRKRKSNLFGGDADATEETSDYVFSILKGTLDTSELARLSFLGESTEEVELSDQQAELAIEEYANMVGLNGTELEAVFTREAILNEKFDTKKRQFVEWLKSATEKRLVEFLNQSGVQLSEANDEEEDVEQESPEQLEVDDEQEDIAKKWLQKALELFDDAVQTPGSFAYNYILSIVPGSVSNAARALANYFKFFEQKCRDNDELQQFDLIKLKETEEKERWDVILKLLEAFIHWLKNSIKVVKWIGTQKTRTPIQPVSIASIASGLLISFKILGLINPRVKSDNLPNLMKVYSLRSVFKNVKVVKRIQAETLTAVDLVELYKRIEITNLFELQFVTSTMVAAESGARPGSLFGVHFGQRNYPGVLLKNLTFIWETDDEFAVIMELHWHKGMRSANDILVHHFKTSGAYSSICAARLLLLFVCTMSYTKKSLLDCLKDKRVEFKEQCLDFPLFCSYDGKTSLAPGSPLKNTNLIFEWLSKMTNVPISLLSFRSLRRGFGQSIENDTYLRNPNANKQTVINNATSMPGWKSCSIYTYISAPIGVQLTTHANYHQPIENAIVTAVEMSNICGVFLSDFWKNKCLNDAQISSIKRFVKLKVDEKKRHIDANSTNKAEIDKLLGKNRKKKLHDMTAEQLTSLEVYKKGYRNEINSMRNKITRDASKLIETFARERWFKAKTDILPQDRFIPNMVASKTNFDYENFDKHFGEVETPVPLGHISSISRFCDVLDNGVPCPMCASDSESLVHVMTLDDYKVHISEAHTTSNAHYCHVEKCISRGKEFSDKDSLARHIKVQHNDYIDFKGFCLSDFDQKCKCNEQFKELEEKCVCHKKEVAYIIATSDKWTSVVNKLSSQKCTSSEITKMLIAKHLKIEQKDLPKCVDKMIHSL